MMKKGGDAMLKQINGVVLFARDFAGTVGFYRDTLGLTVAHEDEGIVDFKTEGAVLSVLDLEVAKEIFGADAVLADAPQAGHRLELAVEVPDVDAAYHGLQQQGVTFLKPPTDQPWGQRVVDFADPEGNIVELYQWTQPH